MLSLNDKQEVKHASIKLGEVFMLEHIKEVLGYRHVLTRMSNMQRTALHAMTINVVCVSYHSWETCNQFHRLTHQVVAREIVGIGVERVHLQHATRKDVHDVRTFKVDDVNDCLVVERHVLVDKLTECVKILFVGQISRKKQIGDFFKAETALIYNRCNKVVKLIATIKQFALGRLQMSVVRSLVAHNITNVGKSDKHTASVLVAQTALHAILLKQIVVYLARVLNLVRQFVNQIFLVHKCYRLLIVRFWVLSISLPLRCMPTKNHCSTILCGNNDYSTAKIRKIFYFVIFFSK